MTIRKFLGSSAHGGWPRNFLSFNQATCLLQYAFSKEMLSITDIIRTKFDELIHIAERSAFVASLPGSVLLPPKSRIIQNLVHKGLLNKNRAVQKSSWGLNLDNKDAYRIIIQDIILQRHNVLA